jgi:hypothetical protein
MPGAFGEIIGGQSYSENDLVERLRLYAQNEKNFQFLSLYEYNTVSILRVLSEKFGTVPSGEVTDFEFKYPEMNELPYEFTPHATSTDENTTHKSLISIIDDEASSLNVGMILSVIPAPGKTAGSFVNKDRTAVATDKKTTALCQNEQLYVESIGASGSASTGYTNITVRRYYPTDDLSGITTCTPITVDMRLVITNVIAAEDSHYNTPSTINSEQLSNVIQTSRLSYGVSSHIKSGIKTFLNQEPLDLAYQMCQTRYGKVIERGILSAEKMKKRVNGKMLYQTGGILEFIPDENVISFNKIIQPKNLLWLIHDIADAVGSTVDEMWMFGGTTYATALATAFDGKAQWTKNEAESVKYRLQVSELIDTGRNMKLKFVAAPILNELGMGGEAIVLNLTDRYKCFQIAEKEPLKDLPEGKESYTEESQRSVTRELYSMWGLVRRLAKTHFRIIDTNISY